MTVRIETWARLWDRLEADAQGKTHGLGLLELEVERP
jgi:hypothetical protein